MNANFRLKTFHDVPILIEQSFSEDRGGYILPTAKSSSGTLSMYFKDLLQQLQFRKDVSKFDCKETKA